MIHFCTWILDLSLIVQDLLVRLTLNFPMDPHGFSAIWIYSKSALKAIILFLAFAAGFPSAASCLLPRFPRVTTYFKKRLRQKEQWIFWDDALAWTENIPSNPKPPVFFWGDFLGNSSFIEHSIWWTTGHQKLKYKNQIQLDLSTQVPGS